MRLKPSRTRHRKIYQRQKRGRNYFLTRGTTEGINLVASSWGTKNLKPGDVILLTEMEHHSNLVPWQLLAQKTGAKVAYIPVTGDEGLLDLSKLDSLLTKQVKIFSMVHISNSMGTLNPVEELCARAAQARHRHARWTVRKAPGICPWTCRPSAAIFLRSPATNFAGPTGIGVLWGRQGTARCHAAISGRWRK